MKEIYMKHALFCLVLAGTVFQITANEALEKGISFAVGAASGLGIGLVGNAAYEYMHSASTMTPEVVLDAPCTRIEIFMRYPEFDGGETFLYPVFNYLAKATENILDKASEFVRSPAMQERMQYLSENQDAIIAVGLALSYIGLLVLVEKTSKKHYEERQSVYEYSSFKIADPLKAPVLMPIPASYASAEVYEPGVVEKGTNPDTVEIVNGICVSTWKSPK